MQEEKGQKSREIELIRRHDGDRGKAKKKTVFLTANLETSLIG